MRRYTYTICLGMSILAAVGLAGGDKLMKAVIDLGGQTVYASVEEQESVAEKPVIIIENDKKNREIQAKGSSAVWVETEAAAGIAAEPAASPEVSEAAAPEAPEAAPEYHFEDTLFIGESRPVGLKEYADLGEADVFATSGMSVYKVFDTRVQVDGKGKLTLEELLTGRNYKRIYLMLGINELGYEFERSIRKYRSVVEQIESLQPDAELYLEANLHVTKKKSESDGIYNNRNIDRFNQYIKDLTDGNGRIFLDVNERFDDGNGNLSPDYTADDAHVMGKYYAIWAEWIRTAT